MISAPAPRRLRASARLDPQRVELAHGLGVAQERRDLASGLFHPGDHDARILVITMRRNPHYTHAPRIHGMRYAYDHRLGVLLELLDQLLEATRLWAAGEELDDAVEVIRHQALLINHARYNDLIPAYHRVAQQQGLVEVDRLDLIVNELMSTDDQFKSYAPEWLAAGDFAAMTRWLDDLFTRPIALELKDGPESLSGIDEWRHLLKAAGVFLMYSSGTSGRISFVPRDQLTRDAMRTNGVSYLNSVWSPRPDASVREFDCLVLGPRGQGMGLLSAGVGLTQMASRARFLFDAEVTADLAASFAGHGDRAGNPGAVRADARLGALPRRDEAFAGAIEFALESGRRGTPLILFGPPFLVHELCTRLTAGPGSLALAADSLLVSGGGWKSFTDARIPQAMLHQMVAATLGIDRSHIIDTYSAVELNCVFMSCSASRYHIPPLIEPVVLDAAYTGTVGAQGAGVLGFLDPFALSYPGFVITGDYGELVRGRCACGLSGWAIAGEIDRAPNHQARGCGQVVAATLA
jgi:Acyl-protein synthetase, LuxE